MKNGIEELERRACFGDAQALAELSRRAESSENEDECKECVEAFECAAPLYAMGTDKNDEWQEFKAIMKKYSERDHCRETVAEHETSLRQLEFETRVLEQLSKDDHGSSRARDEKDVIPSLVEMFAADAEKAQQEVQFCDRWITAARACLKSPRFTQLPLDVFDELIESVAYSLDRMDDGLVDEVCPHCGSTDTELLEE